MWEIILKIILAVGVLLVPGYFTWGLIKTKLPAKSHTIINEIFWSFAISFLVVSYIGFILAELAILSFPLILVCIIIYTLIILLISAIKKGFSFRLKKIEYKQILVLLLVLITVSLFFMHPIKNISGRRDVGLYVNYGISIAKDGRLYVQDDVLKELIENDVTIETGNPYLSANVIDNEEGLIVPYHLHLIQVWVALFYLLFGLTSVFYFNVYASLLGLLAVYLFVKHLLNWKIATLVVLLLGTNYVQIYFSQYISPEILFQSLFFIALAAFVTYEKSKLSVFSGIFSLAIGALFLTRIDANLIFPFVVLPVIHGVLRGKYKKRFLIFLILVLIFISFYYNSYGELYVTGQSANLSNFDGISFDINTLIYIYIGILISVLILSGIRRIRKLYELLSKKIVDSNQIKSIVIFAILLFFCYIIYKTPSAGLGHYGNNLLMISQYVSWAGLLLGIAGFLYLFKDKINTSNAIFFYATIVLMIYLFPHLHNSPIQPWGMRRYVSIILPAIVIGIGYILHLIYLRNKRIAYAIAMLLLIFNITFASILLKDQFDTMPLQVSEFANKFKSDDLLLLETRYSDVHIPLALKSIYDRKVIDVSGIMNFRRKDIQQYLVNKVEKGERVFYITHTDEYLNKFRNSIKDTPLILTFVDEYQFNLTHLEWNYVLQSEVGPVEYLLSVYSITIGEK